jgi:hypothetical protein
MLFLCLSYFFFIACFITVTVSLCTLSTFFRFLALLFHYLSRSALISVIVRRPNNTLVLYCKGADNVILERLKTPTTKEEEQLIANSKKHTTQFAADGLRTLMISKWCDTQ